MSNFNTAHRLDVYIHSDPSVTSQLREILEGINCLHKQGDRIMATLQDLQQNIDDINTATNTVAAEIDALKGQINPGNITPEQADALNQQLSGISKRLQSIGTPDAPAGNVGPTDPTPV